MKISEAIKILQEVREKSGDIEMVTLAEFDGAFCVEYDKIFEVIEVPVDPNDESEDAETELVCALMDDPDQNNGLHMVEN